MFVILAALVLWGGSVPAASWLLTQEDMACTIVRVGFEETNLIHLCCPPHLLNFTTSFAANKVRLCVEFWVLAVTNLTPTAEFLDFPQNCRYFGKKYTPGGPGLQLMIAYM